MTDILQTGKSALFAFQRALTTTSHNIANVNTQGYSRQRIDFEALTGNNQRGQYIGAGVYVGDIQRVQDEFATARLNSAESAYRQQQTHSDMGERIDNLIATDGINVTPAINDLFNSIQDANNEASSIAMREVVLDRAEQLAYQFRTLQGQLDDTQVEINSRLTTSADRISQIAQSVADINKQVVSLQGSRQAQAANDLLDQREQLVGELSEIIEVDTSIQGNGAMNVYIGKGLALVMNTDAQSIRTVPDDKDTSKLQYMVGIAGRERRLAIQLLGGEIGGLNDFATKTLQPAKQELGRVAVVMAEQMNLQHSRGIDLKGDAGEDLFRVSAPRALSSNINTGTGALSATINDASALYATDYALAFDGSQFTITRTSDGQQTTGNLPLSLDGLDISMTGTPAAGDTFILSATSHAAESMQSIIQDPEKLALSGRLSTNSDLSNIGDARISNPTVLDPDDASLTNPIDIVFTSDTTYNIVDVNSSATLVTGATYSEGAAIALNGWEVSISGPAHEGDTHHITRNLTGGGSNGNGIALADMQIEPVVGGNQSFNAAFSSLVARVGSNTNTARSSARALESLRDNAVDRQQAIQGVSLDEEAIDLTRYQQAYQAAAQIISVADDMFQTILGAVR